MTKRNRIGKAQATKLRNSARKLADTLDNLSASVEQDGMTEAEAMALRIGSACLRFATPAQIANAVATVEEETEVCTLRKGVLCVNRGQTGKGL